MILEEASCWNGNHIGETNVEYMVLYKQSMIYFVYKPFYNAINFYKDNIGLGLVSTSYCAGV